MSFPEDPRLPDFASVTRMTFASRVRTVVVASLPEPYVAKTSTRSPDRSSPLRALSRSTGKENWRVGSVGPPVRTALRWTSSPSPIGASATAPAKASIERNARSDSAVRVSTEVVASVELSSRSPAASARREMTTDCCGEPPAPETERNAARAAVLTRRPPTIVRLFGLRGTRMFIRRGVAGGVADCARGDVVWERRISFALRSCHLWWGPQGTENEVWWEEVAWPISSSRRFAYLHEPDERNDRLVA